MKETSLLQLLLWYFKTDLYETLFPLKSSRFASFTNQYNEENLRIWKLPSTRAFHCRLRYTEVMVTFNLLLFVFKPWLNFLGEFSWWSRWENSETAYARLESIMILNDYYILYSLSVFNAKREISYIQVAMLCSICCINSNEISNHFNWFFCCKWCDLLCNNSNVDLFMSGDDMSF